MSRLLFVSSYNTGHGHKSITAALTEQFSKLDPSLQVDEVDGFMLGGRLSAAMSRLYDKVAVHAPAFWKLYYSLGNVFPAIANYYTAASMEKAFCRLIEANRPDIIVSVHPCYVSSVADILEKHRLEIPVISLVADLDNVTRLWADKRSAYTLCPSENARQSMLKYSIMDSRVKVTGFPVRDRFNHYTPDFGKPGSGIAEKKKINFLIMNGSQGLGRSEKMAGELLEHFDCNVVILAGNNSKVKVALEDSLRQYGNRLTVCGFVENVEKYMIEADILLLRASPNVMMEAVNLCRPFIITGSLTGQEEKNPDFAVENQLGVVCKDIKQLPAVVEELLSRNGSKYNDIIRHQLEYRNPDAAMNTAKFILDVLREYSPGGGL